MKKDMDKIQFEYRYDTQFFQAFSFPLSHEKQFAVFGQKENICPVFPSFLSFYSFLTLICFL